MGHDVRCGCFESILGPHHAFIQWIHAPESWLGVHRIVGYLTSSLSVVLFFMGIATLNLALWVGDNWRTWFKHTTKV